MNNDCEKCGEHCLNYKCNTVIVTGCPICEKCEKYSIHCKCSILHEAECNCYIHELKERIAFLEEGLDQLTNVVKQISDHIRKNETTHMS